MDTSTFTDVLGGLTDSAANLLGAINGRAGQNATLTAQAQQQAAILSAQQAQSASTSKIMMIGAAVLAGVLVLFLFLKK